MESLVLVLSIVIVVIWVLSWFSGKETKNVKKDLASVVGLATEEWKVGMHKQAVISDNEWLSDLEEEFGLDKETAVANSQALRASLTGKAKQTTKEETK